MREAIEGTEKYDHLEIYMFLSDDVGWAIAESLAVAVCREVPVRVVYDAIGSLNASEQMFQMMRDAGVQVEVFRPGAPMA